MWCDHVFGRISSTSCLNYAFKRTVTDNTDQYGQEAAKVVRNKFYLDDLLKSIDDTKPAMILVKNVVHMCKSGGLTIEDATASNLMQLACAMG